MTKRPTYRELVVALAEALDIASAELELDECLAQYGEPCANKPNCGRNEYRKSGLCSVCDMTARLPAIAAVYEQAMAAVRERYLARHKSAGA